MNRMYKKITKKEKISQAFVESYNLTKLLKIVQDLNQSWREAKTAIENERTSKRVKKTKDQISTPGLKKQIMLKISKICCSFGFMFVENFYFNENLKDA